MHLEERYRRVSADTLELVMTRHRRESTTRSRGRARPSSSSCCRKDSSRRTEGWAGLLEDICAPMDEFDFIRTIRDPARTGKAGGAREEVAREPDVVGSAGALRGVAGQHAVRGVARGLHVADRGAARGSTSSG